jgi:hypothetical protein
VIWSVAALLLGLIVVVALAALCSPLAEQPDPSTVWEAWAATTAEPVASHPVAAGHLPPG